MRFRSIVGVAVLALAVLSISEGDSQAQFGGFDMKNPDSFFNRYAQAQGTKDELVIDKVQSRMDPEMSTKMKTYAAQAGISNGKLTKAQFADFWTKVAAPQMEERMKQRGGGFFGKGGGGPGGGFNKGPGGPGGAPSFPGGGPPGSGGPGGGFGGFNKGPGGPGGGFGGFNRGPGGPPSPMPPTTPAPTGEKTAGNTSDKDKAPGASSGYQPQPFDEEEAKSYFKRMDSDGNGSLNDHEYERSNIRREMDRWDTNKNNVVELTEWIAYMKERHNKREEERKQWEDFRAARNGGTTPGTPAVPAPYVPTVPVPFQLDRPVVIRADNLPKELPAWFKELNTDNDAQVSLAEWRAKERDHNEFRNFDRNGDGLITVDEVLWYTRNADRLTGITPTGPMAPAISTATKSGLEKSGGPSPEKGKGAWGGFGGRSRGNKGGGKDSPSKDAPRKEFPRRP